LASCSKTTHNDLFLYLLSATPLRTTEFGRFLIRGVVRAKSKILWTNLLHDLFPYFGACIPSNVEQGPERFARDGRGHASIIACEYGNGCGPGGAGNERNHLCL
jgi:hypothetical protein